MATVALRPLRLSVRPRPRGPRASSPPLLTQARPAQRIGCTARHKGRAVPQLLTHTRAPRIATDTPLPLLRAAALAAAVSGVGPPSARLVLVGPSTLNRKPSDADVITRPALGHFLAFRGAKRRAASFPFRTD